MTQRRLISTGSEYEKKWGYSRAVVDDAYVFVSGTTGFNYATMTISDDPAEQTRQAFTTIAKVLRDAGSALEQAVRVHYYVPNAKDWEACAAVAGEFLGEIRPACTALVCGLVDPRMKIEIEITARRLA